MPSDTERIAALEAKVAATDTRLTRLAVDHCKRLDALEAVAAPVTAVENWLEAAKVTASPVYFAILATVGGIFKLGKKLAYPAALMAIGVALFVGSQHVGGCNPFVPKPDPTPTPIPDPPKPPAPIPLAGFRVLIVYDSTATKAQQSILYGRTVRDYLNSKVATGADGKSKELRIYQSGVDVSGEVQWIQDAFQRHPGQTSWMVVSDGKSGYDGPIPATADDAMVIFKKYAEGK